MKKSIFLFFGICVFTFTSCTDENVNTKDVMEPTSTSNTSQSDLSNTITAFGKAYSKFMYYKHIEDPNYTDHVIEEARLLLEEYGEAIEQQEYKSIDEKELTIEKAFNRYMELTMKKNR